MKSSDSIMAPGARNHANSADCLRTSSKASALETRNACFGYGRIPVVHDLNLNVRRGEIVALLGPNGAGKTTTLLGLGGALAPTSGEVLWHGRPIMSPVHVRSRGGLVLVPEDRGIVHSLTVADNLRLGKGGIEGALEFAPELAALLRRKAGLLSGGEQKILTLSRALATSPEVLLADELSLGLAPLVVRRLLAAVRDGVDRLNVGVLLVEQHVREALRFADRAYVMRRGRILMEGAARELEANWSDIQKTYLARDVGEEHEEVEAQ